MDKKDALVKMYKRAEADHRYYTEKLEDAFATMQALDAAIGLLDEQEHEAAQA